MSDLFHKDIPPAFVDAVFDVMEETPRHVYHVLTKRSSLMRDYLRRRYAEAPGQAPRHIWCGVSVEDQQAAVRVRHLQEAPVATRFVSMEPLIGPVAISLAGIAWLIAGGESGPGAPSDGYGQYGTVAHGQASRSSSSNGVGAGPVPAVGCWTGSSTTLSRRTLNKERKNVMSDDTLRR